MRRKSQLFSAEYAENNNYIIYQMVEQLFIIMMPDYFSLMSLLRRPLSWWFCQTVTMVIVSLSTK